MSFFNKAMKKDEVVEVDLESLEVEGKNRYDNLPSGLKKLASGIAIVWTLFQLYTGFCGVLPAVLQRSTTMGFGLVLAFLTFSGARSGRSKIPLYDWVFAALSIACVAYLWANFDYLVLRGGSPILSDVVMGCVALVLVLEATRRCVGIPLVAVAGIFLLYAFTGPYLPGMIGHRGYSIKRVASQMFITLDGLLGTPMSVATTFVFAFILFGVFLEVTGGAKLFINLAFALTGRFPGGPAKTAVVASGLLGTISGSSLANVVTTGSFTIPLMKKCGYKASFAGGVEASSSSAGQIMPPVMGAAAFIMSEMTGIPYMRICAAAAIPAILYYLSVMLTVDLEARRTHLKTIPREEIPRLGPTLAASVPLLFPLFTIVFLMVKGFTPLKAALYSTIVMIVGSFFGKETRMTPAMFVEALKKSAFNAVTVTVACAVCGIVTGVITLTGLGLKLSDLILQASGGRLLPTLLFTMVASIILGMGLPTTAKYIVLSAIAAPALTKLGVPLVGAHLFILYFGVIAEVTPPVALTSYAGAAVARAPGMETALQGLRISIAAFFIPFMFCYYPSLLFENVTAVGMISGLLSSLIGVVCLATSSIGYLFGPLKLWQRIVLFCGTLMVIMPSFATDLAGIAVITAMVLVQLKKSRREKAHTA